MESQEVCEGAAKYCLPPRLTVRCEVAQNRRPAPGGRGVPSAFCVAYWNAATGDLTRVDAYHDSYVEVGGVLLPAARRVSVASTRAWLPPHQYWRGVQPPTAEMRRLL